MVTLYNIVHKNGRSHHKWGKKKGPDNESLINCFWTTQNEGLNRRQWWLTQEQTEK